MNLTKPQVEAAITAGLALTDPESETLVAMKYAPGLLILRGILQAIGSGALALQLVQGMAPESDTPPKPSDPKKPNGRKVRKVKPPAKTSKKQRNKR